tara:strand:- start:2115 stop:2753 length:639 start_codon:yes stop_codon:yes gene_type:complete
MLGLGNNNQTPMNTGALNLGVSAQQPMMQQQQWGQQQSPFGGMGASPFMQGMTGGPSQQWGQPPVAPAPPSEIELQIMLLRGIVPVDRFFASQQMATLVQLLNNLMSFSLLEVMKNAVFVEDGDGNLKMDITQLPSHLQTMSAENIKADFNTLQSTAQQNIATAEGAQQQIALMAQQSMMGGALSAALANEGVMEKVGGGVGSVARGLMGMR